MSLVTVYGWNNSIYTALQALQVVVVGVFVFLLNKRFWSWRMGAYALVVETAMSSFVSASLAGPYASEVLANMYVMNFLLVLAMALTENIAFGFCSLR